MKTEAHTPGPWDCIHYDAYSEVVTHTPIFSSVCDVHTASDARLIAAAPTMFDYVQLRADAGCPEAIKILEAINARS